MPEPSRTELAAEPVTDTRAVQRRTVALLSIAQVTTSIPTAAVVTIGPLLAVAMAGTAASGAAGTAMAVGSTIAAALLAQLANRFGRRPAQTTGILGSLAGTALVIVGAHLGWFWLTLVGSAGVGFGTAANLQARFAATDVAEPRHRGRDLSIVVWLGTIGAIAGANLVTAGTGVEQALGMVEDTGLYLIALGCVAVSFLVVFLGLRPDPLVLARQRAGESMGSVRRPGVWAGLKAVWRIPRARAGLAGVVVGHTLMVGVMSVTPVHMQEHGAAIVLVGVVISLHMFGMYGLSPVWGLLADRLGGIRVVMIGIGTLLVASILAAAAGTDDVVTTIALTLLGLGWGAATVAGAVVLVGAVAFDDRVAAQGASDTLMNLGGAIGALVAGFALAWTGYAGVGIAAAVIAVAIGAFVLVNARRGAVVEPGSAR